MKTSKTSTYFLTLTTAAVLALGSHNAAAALINVNLGGGDAYGAPTLPADQVLQSYTGPAVVGGAGDTWNNFDLSSANQTLALSNSAGGSTNATLTFTAYASYITSDTNDGFVGTSYAPLMASYLNNYGEVNQQTVTLDGLDAGTYSLYLYSQNNEATDTAFTLNDSTLDANNPHDLPGHDNQGNSTDTNGSPSTFVQGVNYVEFKNVTVDGTGNLVFGWGNAVASANGAVFNGFQLDSVESTPEPSTWALMLVGAVVLALQLRRRHT